MACLACAAASPYAWVTLTSQSTPCVRKTALSTLRIGSFLPEAGLTITCTRGTALQTRVLPGAVAPVALIMALAAGCRSARSLTRTGRPYARAVSEAALPGCMDLQCSCRRRASARVEHEVAR